MKNTNKVFNVCDFIGCLRLNLLADKGDKLNFLLRSFHEAPVITGNRVVLLASLQ